MYFSKKENFFNIFLVCILMFMFISVSCAIASSPKYSGVLRVATTASPATLDTMSVVHAATREIGIHI